jgi:LEA14-like dessication related protein
MKSSARTSLIALFLILFLLPSCYQKPSLEEIVDLDFTELKDSILYATIKIQVLNPNRVGVSIKSQEASVYIKEVKVGRTFTDQSFKLSGKQTSQIAVESAINLEQLSKIFETILKEKSTKVSVDGIYVVDAGLHNMKIRSNTVSELNVQQELSRVMEKKLGDNGFTIKKVGLNRVGGDSTNLDFEIAFRNTFPFEYIIEDLDIDVYLGKSSTMIGSWALSEPVSLSPDAQEYIKGQVSIVNRNLFSSIGGLLGKQTIKIKGDVSIQLAGHEFFLPIVQEIPISAALPFGN